MAHAYGCRAKPLLPVPYMKTAFKSVNMGLSFSSGMLSLVSSFFFLSGFLNDQDATDQMVDNSGWLHTGDIGYYDEDQHFFIVDSLKNVIKFRGHQVS